VVLGAGIRGHEIYGEWIRRRPQRVRAVGVAEPSEQRRKAFATAHDLPDSACFADWRDLLERGRLADACLITTQDREHAEPAIRALQQGYHVLLEKPMAPTAEECRRIVEAAEHASGQLRLCHVLRYAPFFRSVQRTIRSGELGRVLHIDHAEHVGYWHFGHSFVRGNWNRADTANPLILAKSCHDLDLLYWFVASPVDSVSSTGSLSWYRSENAPDGAPERCTDGCPEADRCPWYAPDLYLRGKPLIGTTRYARNPVVRALGRLLLRRGPVLRALARVFPPLKRLLEWRRWPATAISTDQSEAGRWEALRSGPYGRCVFHSDNTVVDHQSALLNFENGTTASLSVDGFSYLDGRWIRIEGSHATLEGHFTNAGQELRIYPHGKAGRLLYRRGMDTASHGGADQEIMEAFFASLEQDDTNAREKPSSVGASEREDATSARASLESHLTAFAAERARSEQRVVRMSEVRGEQDWRKEQHGR
jgi:predicted dehydrogenase